MAAIDIVSFGAPHRDDHTQLHLRQLMYQYVHQAFNITNILWTDCYQEDRGDGVLILIPPDIPVEDLLDPLGYHLTAILRRHNRLASQIAQLQLRLAVHIGRVHRDPYGVAGKPVNHLFRLLEACAFKKALADSGADLGMIVSDRFYTDATDHGALIDPHAYRPLHITCKETRARAWVWFPPPSTTTPSNPRSPAA